MGGSRWSDDAYSARKAYRSATGASTFAYTDSIRKGSTAAKTHETLDPVKMKAGTRECRDSEAHPNSTPIFIGLDVTGSMGQVPITMQTKLKEVMGLLLKRGYVEDPAICISGIGDVEAGDRAPFQVGQFESGIEIEDNLTNLYIEGGGGGNRYESYDIALYFLARCVKADSFEKRNKKGYAFIICDEGLPRVCKGSSIKTIFNTDAQDIIIEDLIAEVLEKWELFVIVPNMTSHYKTSYQDKWVEVLGQRVIFLEDPNVVSETIASAIGLLEEEDMSSIAENLKDVGLSSSSVGAVTTALSKLESNSITKTSGTGLTVL